ncbi:histone H2A.N [Loxodonta africana]|uniref:histone H2B n=1 Tax=Elephas maximus indicus TaxID=99487 RepID=UPI00211721F1|nr:histone H2B [Elephas maximus indicus]
MYYVCLGGLKFPKKSEVHIPAKKKYEWANSAFEKKRRRRRRKKKEAHFCYMGKILKQTHPDFSGCSWVLEALGCLDDWQLEWVSLEAVRLSFYKHRRAITSREILEAMKQRSPRRSF